MISWLFALASITWPSGYTPEDIPKAMEDWPSFLSDLQSKLPIGVTALSINAELARIMSILQTTGSYVYKEDGAANLNDPNIIAATDFIANMYQSGYAKTPREIGNDWVGDTFGIQKAAIAIEGNWMIGHLANNFSNVTYGTLEMPTYNGKPNTLSFTVAYSVNMNSKNKEAANELVMHLTDVENMKTWCEGAGVLPSRESVAKDMKLENNPIQANIINGVDYATPWQYGVTLSTISREFNNWFPKIYTGEMTARNALEEATKTANSDIEYMY